MDKPLLEVRNLTVAFDTERGQIRPVRNLSLSIFPGQTVALVGESGCGKSVTALSILRLIPQPPGRILDGEVLLQDRNLLSLEEREIRLSPKQFAMLWPATRGRRLHKTRYEIPWKKMTIEVDVYHGRNHGLIVAEVEFPNQVSRRKFKPPPWFGREITGEKRYSNIKLARE